MTTEIQNTEIEFANEQSSSFGGRNKARRLKRAIAKGKTGKIAKLAPKVQAIADKLAAKGKIDSKRYALLTAALEAKGEAGLSDAEAEELGNMQDAIEREDPTLTAEIDKAAAADEKFLWMPKPIGITVAVVGGLGVLIGGFFLIRHFVKKR